MNHSKMEIETIVRKVVFISWLSVIKGTGLTLDLPKCRAWAKDLSEEFERSSRVQEAGRWERGRDRENPV